MKTKVITDESFKNNRMFKVYEVDEDGNKAVEFDRKTGEKKEKKPLLQFGESKAYFILAHIDEIKEFTKGPQE